MKMLMALKILYIANKVSGVIIDSLQSLPSLKFMPEKLGLNN